jgi:hypothetical protein
VETKYGIRCNPSSYMDANAAANTR